MRILAPLALVTSICAVPVSMAWGGGPGVAAAALAEGAIVKPAPRVTYEGHKVVRVTMRDMRDVRLMQTLSDDPWTCGWDGISPGTVDFRVSEEAFQALASTDVPYRVAIGDVQQAIARERDQASLRGGGWFADYKDYTQVNAFLDDLVTARPDLASRVTLTPNSIEGRALPCIRISSAPPGTKPAIVVEGCQHAREWVTVMATTWVADQLIGYYDTNASIKQIVDNFEVYVVPIVNPDGYVYTWTTNRLWRKNRRNNGASFGVDLNRNWSEYWTNTFGNSTSPSSDLYKGTSPFSEPCSQAMRDLVNGLPNVALFFDVHSYSQLLLGPFGGAFTLAADTRAMDEMMSAMQPAIYAVHNQVYVGGSTYRAIYPASGTAQDWAYAQRGCLAMGLELRDYDGSFGFVLPADQIIPNAEEWFAGFMAAANYVHANAVTIHFPNERPTKLQSGAATSQLVIFNKGRMGVLSTPANPPTVSVRSGRVGPFTTTALANAGIDEAGGQTYSHSLSAGVCGSVVQWYYTVQAADGSFINFPAGGAAAPYEAVANSWTTVRFDDFQGATGWLVGDPSAPDNATSGIWTRVDPNGYQGQAEYDHTPLSGTTCYVTGNTTRGSANQYVQGGKTTLRSPVLDLSAAPNAEVSFYLWFWDDRQYVPAFGNYPFVVDVTNNAGASPTWVRVLTINGDGPVEETAMLAWRRYSFKVQDFVSPTSTVQVRFVATAGNTGLWLEGGVDDFSTLAISCDKVWCPADFNGDGTKTVQDLFDFLKAYFAQDLAADANNSGAVTVQDLFDYLADFFLGCP